MTRFLTQSELSGRFRAFIAANGHILPRHVRRYRWASIGRFRLQNPLGLECQPGPVDGKVVCFDAELLALQMSPSQFAAIDPAILPPPCFEPVTGIGPGNWIKVSPYVRKGLDGLPTDASRPSGEVRIARIGHILTALPGNPDSPYLRDLKLQLENLPMPDGFRTIGNALADWKADNFIWSEPGPDGCEPSGFVSFDVQGPAFAGGITILYDRGSDTYQLRFVPQAGPAECLDDVYFDDLGIILSRRLGDEDSWYCAQVDIISRPTHRHVGGRS